MKLVKLAVGGLACVVGGAAPAALPLVRATEPPSLRVEVMDGGRTQVLTFDPPVVARATGTGPIPGNHNPAQEDVEQLHGWNAFCPLPPEDPKILGYFFRGIPAESVVLKNHDGTKAFVRGEDYYFSGEFGQVLALNGRLGKRAADMKNPQPAEQLQAEFQYFQQRLDLVQVDRAGRASVKKGAAAIMCPELPEADDGCVGLAGVWVYGAHGTGPVPATPGQVTIMPADIAPIAPRPPVAPVNPQALAKAMAKLNAGKPVGIGFFGDSISVGAEAPDWYFHTYSPRNRGFVGMVIRDLRARYPQGDVQPTWGIAGAQSIFNEQLWQNVIKRAPAPTGPLVWWEAEAGTKGSGEFTLANDEERRVVSAGQWRVLTPGAGAEYRVDVPAGGPWHSFLRQTIGRGKVRWRWDDGSWTVQDDAAKPTDADDVRRGLALCWFDLGEAALTPGRHVLRVEAVGEATAMDCFALTTDERGPWRKYRPGELTVDVVVYAMGMNGGFNEKTPREKHKETILRHIGEARGRGAEVVLVATMENNCRLLGDPTRSKKPNRDLLAEIAGETGCAFADVYTEWMNQEYRGVPPESRLHNFINHPGVAGHRLWADVILRCFEAAGPREAAKGNGQVSRGNVALGVSPSPSPAAGLTGGGDAARPNLVLFLSDDHGVLDCGPYGARDVRTPALDTLARQSVRFEQAFAASPTCTPSRSSIYSGLFPIRHGAHPNHSDLRPGIRAWPHHLRALGYETVLVGKLDVRPLEASPFDIMTDKPMEDPDKVRWFDEWLTKRDRAKPFCLVFATNAPHVGWDTTNSGGYDPAQVALPPTFVDTTKTREARTHYYSSVTRMDQTLGEVLRLLDEHGHRDDTVFLYTADQGAQWPLAKWNLYDAGIRVPLLARWPGVIRGGTSTVALVSHVDLLATFIALAGGKSAADLDSQSFLPVLQGKTNRHRDAVFATHTSDGCGNAAPMRCVRTSRYKYIRNLMPELFFMTCEDVWQNTNFFGEWEDAARAGDPHAREVIRRYHWRPAEELYDLVTDPFEQHNRIDDPQLAGVARDLRARLDQWRQQQNDTGPDMPADFLKWSREQADRLRPQSAAAHREEE